MYAFSVPSHASYRAAKKIIFSTPYPNELTRCIKTGYKIKHFKNPLGKGLEVHSTDFPLQHLG
jgi:hypothetical protein